MGMIIEGRGAPNKSNSDLQIGDIKFSANKYSDDQWLLCNGRSIDQSLYPELATLYADDITKSINNTDIGISTINYLRYSNGYWVACGTKKVDSKTTIKIVYSTDLSGSWAEKTIYTASSTTGILICRALDYVYNTWVILIQETDNSSSTTNYNVCVAYASTKPTNTWTVKTVYTTTSSSSRIYPYCINRCNGYWVIGGEYDNNDLGALLYSSTFGGTFTLNNNFTSSIKAAIIYVTYTDSKYVAISTAGTIGGGSYIFYMSSLSSPFATKVDVTNADITDIIYVNGYWVATAFGQHTIAYSTSLTSSTWTTPVSSVFPTGYYTQKIIYDGEYFIASATNTNNNSIAAIAYTADITTDTWTVVILNPGNGMIVYGDPYYADFGSSSIRYSKNFNFPSTLRLPNIIVDYAYAYIKAN